MDCAGCGRANRAGAKFCGGCGKPLAPRCPACGIETQPGSQFCDACGASLVAPQAAAAEARKVVTIVFADLIGSTALHERLDAESARRLMDRYHRSMGSVVEAHGGTVMQLLGDGVLAGFGVPRVAEDDAIRAVRAAVGMQQAFRELAADQAGLAGDIGLRVAVYTGEVVAGDDHTHVMGDPVNVAARLQQEARDGDVLLGESTQRLVAEKVTLAPFGSFALKGRAERVAAYRVLSLERPAGAPAIAFVGRDGELRRIRAVYDTAVETRAARLAVILGSPGLGKSRLIDEFTRRLGAGATVLMAHCDAAGGATFAPLAEALRGLLRIDDGASGDTLRAAILAALPEGAPERARIADGVAALVAGTPASPEEIFFVVRRGLASLAAVRPVVLAIDDIQWAEPLLHDLLEHLVQWGSDAPLLVLAAARPELRDARSSLATPGGLVSDVVTLAGLDAGAATRLAANVIGAEALPAAIAGRVLATSEGNPLFVGELVRMLVHDGALKLEGERWTAGVEVADLEMPPTIHALLAARIERLRPEERTVLERAAVIGRHFSRTALAQLLPRELGDLDARLESLRRSELVEPDTGWFLGEPLLRFHHVLIRDAAYRRLLKNTRAELHGRFADWLEARAAGSVEHDETLGWHLEQAHQHLRELGPIDAPGRALGERAARHLAAAGRRALARDDLTPAASLLERALARLDAADPARAELTLDWCEALLSAGDVGTGARAIDELGRSIGDSDRLRAWHTCFGGQLAVLTDPKALRASAEAVEAAAVTLTSAGDAAGEAKAHSVHALVLAQLGKIGACEAALDKALAAARRARDRRRANAVLSGAPVAALWGPSPVTRASGRCLDVVRVLRITQGAPAVEAVALRCQAVLETLRGRAEAARRMIASSRRMVEELGIWQRVLEADLFAGLIELLEGDAAAAEQCLRVAYEGLRLQGLGIDAAQAAALLGRALLAQGRVAEAEAISIESESLAGDSFKAAIAWRGVRAEALAARGEHAAAIEFARAAVEIAAATDDLLDHADARQALAIALRAAGRSAEAGAEEKRAIELWEAKGATLLVERARRGTTASPRAVPAPAEVIASPRAIRPRVARNHAALHLARIEEAVAAGDVEAVRWLLGETQALDHVAGRSYSTDSIVANFDWMIARSAGLEFGSEPIAALGDSLALARWRESGSEVRGDDLPIGPFEVGGMVLVEADSEARSTRVELFAPDRLGEAIARLYERYAELLPDGPARTRAAATARSVAAMVGPPALDRWSRAFAPSIEFVDHRLVGLGSLWGAAALIQSIGALRELSDDFATRVDDVLGLRSDALLVRWKNSGTLRAGGGAFERDLCQLWVFGTDGLLTHWEQFDRAQETEALARFDELRAEPPRSARRVRPNAATAHAAREDAAFAARDADALVTLFADQVEVVDHPNGATLDRAQHFASLRRLLRTQDLTRRHEPLATLGDALALCRMSLSAGGIARGDFDVGAYEAEAIVQFEVDAQGRCRRSEQYAGDHLGDAIVRLFERYAELLPDGPARTRAASTARSAAAMLAPFDLDRSAQAFAPGIESVDHRILGTWSARGAEALRQHFRSLLEVAYDISLRKYEVLGLQPDALLVRRSHFGTDRVSGGAYERPVLMLLAFGTDGLLARIEWFDADRDAEALARFDELTAQPPKAARRVRPNAATANAARAAAVTATRDAEALSDLFAQDLAVEDHQRGVSYDREGALATWRSMLEVQDLRFRELPLATLGDSLALLRQSSGGVSVEELDFGPFELERILLIEVDAQGRRRRAEIFASNHLDDAIARLYERYAERLPDGPPRQRAAATARSVAAMLGPFNVDRFATAIAPAIECVDHRILGTWSARGAEELLEHFRSQLEVAADISNHHEILCLQPDALLVRRTQSGTDRASGGAYERPLLMLMAFGTDGLLTRGEWFDADRDAEALARFDEVTAEATPARPARRRVRANAATANLARADAAFANRDADAFPILLADRVEVVDHTTGAAYDRSGLLATQRSLLSAGDPAYFHEALATLGDSLALSRGSTSASGFRGAKFDVGAYEREEIILIEVDAQGLRRRSEVFATDHLGEAVSRLYERYAELLPDGAERTRAAATVRSIAAFLGSFNPNRWATAFAPAIEVVDHRTLGTWSMRGAEALLQNFRAWQPLTDDTVIRLDEILSLLSDAFLGRRTFSGTDRTSGGVFERQFIQLCVFGRDGLMTRLEYFETDRDAEALARFDELTVEPPRFERRVRLNAATALAARLDAAIAGRDVDTLPTLLGDNTEVIEHATGATFDRQGLLASWGSLLSARDPTSLHEPLAILGDSLALFRVAMSGTGFAGKTFDVGPYEIQTLVLIEVDAQGRRGPSESFAPDRLGDGITCLYERYADLLPEGPARTRAAATARSVAALLGPFDPESYAAANAPNVESADHRILGTWSARGPDAILQNSRSMSEIADNLVNRVDDILGLRSDAFLTHWTHLGTDRAGGGAYENRFFILYVFGTDGLVTRSELFDSDRDAEALARFDELTAEPPPPAFANAAWRTMQRFERCWDERDWDGMVATLAPTHRTDDRRRLMRVELSTAESFASLRFVFELSASRWHNELLATRGERLVLIRVQITGRSAESGPVSEEHLQIVEVDAEGRQAAIVAFDLEDLDAAYAELDERYVAGEAAPHASTWQATQRLSRVLSARDWAQWPSVLSQDFVLQDHRLLGWGTRSSDEFLAQTRAMAELAPDFRFLGDHVLAINHWGMLNVGGWVGTREGGLFEIRIISVTLLGPDGRIRRIHTYDLDQLDAARACFEELTAEPRAPARRFENAVTRAEDVLQRAWEARDWEAFAAFFPPHFRSFDRRPLMHLEMNRDELLGGYRPFFEMGIQRSPELLATRGERLALYRLRLHGSEADAGPSEVEFLQLIETDANGERIAGIGFGPDDLDGAYAELDERFAAGEGAPHLGMLATGQRLVRLLSEGDRDQLTSLFTEDFFFADHRPLGWGTRSRDEFVAQNRVMIELAPDARARTDHILALDRRVHLSVGGWVGSREGGSFEIPSVSVIMHGPDGRIRRLHSYALDQLEAARACFDALAAEPPAPAAPIENAATRQADRVSQAWAARDWERLTELYPAGCWLSDRKRVTQLGELDRTRQLELIRPIFDMSSSRLVQVFLATRGDRLTLARQRFEVADRDVGPSEIESLVIIEVDEHGNRVAIVRFDADAFDAAYAELDARYAAGEAAPHARVTAGMREFMRAFTERDWDALAARCAPEIVVHDRRLLGWETLHGPAAYLEALHSLVELAPDTRLRLDHVELCANGYLVVTVWEGTRDGGAYEAPSLMVAELDNEGRIRRFDQYDLDRLDAARARYAELRESPLRIPPNAATRAAERWLECVEARDWEALRALCAPSFMLDDRRRLMLFTGDREMAVTNNQVIAELGARAFATVLATAGDRLALTHYLWTSGDATAVSEVEVLNVLEVDPEGRVVATITLDPDDRRAASAELLARDPHSDPIRRAMSDHDLDRLRAALPEEFVLRDHRRTGLGQLGKDDYLSSLAALFAQAPDVIIEPLYTVAAEVHANLSAIRMFGTLAEGGAFESVMLRLASFRGEQMLGMELFEPEDLGAARACFEALRPS